MAGWSMPVLKTRKKILIVEDERIIALYEQKLLEHHGYDIVTTHSGEDAVSAAMNTPDINLILMDIDLGEGIDGTEAAQQIIRYRDIPVLFLSSHTEPEIVEKTEKITSYGYVVKNSGETVLLTSISMAFKLFQAHRDIAEQNKKMEYTTIKLLEMNEKLMLREKDLEKSELRFRSIVEHAPEPIFIQTENCFAYLNPAALAMLGACDESQLIGLPVYARVHPDYHSVVGERINKLNNERRAVNDQFEQLWFRMDGKEIWVETVAEPVEFEGKNGALVFVRDITGRIKSEENILRANRLFEASQKIAHVGSWELDIKSGAMAWSDEVYRIFGIQTGIPITNDDFMLAVHPDDRSMVNEAYDRSLRENLDGYEIEHRIIRHQDSKIRHVYEKCTHIRDESGRIRSSLGIVQDITNREYYLNSLNSAENYIRTIIETSVDGFWVINDELRLIEVNKAYCRLIGYSRKELLNMTINQIDQLENPAETKARVERIMKNGWELFETSHRKKNGELLHLQISASRHFDTGRFRMICFCQDISERKRAQALAQEQLEHLKILVNVLDLGSWEWNIQSGTTNINEGWARILGYSLEELSPTNIHTWERLTHPDDISHAQTELDKHLLGEEPSYNAEYRMIHKDGHYVWVLDQGKIVSYDSEGRPLLMFGAHKDITPKKTLEIEIERQLAEKSAVLKEAHHRMKNNLSMLQNLLSGQLRGLSNPEALAILNDAAANIAGMRILYEKLLISDDDLNIETAGYLNGLIDAVVNLYVAGTHIAVEREIDNFSMSSKRLFPLGIIINELITNSFKYAYQNRPNGYLRIFLKKQSSRIELVVHDDGPGISQKRADKSQGFGLTLVKMLCEQISAQLRIEGKHGARISVNFEV